MYNFSEFCFNFDKVDILKKACKTDFKNNNIYDGAFSKNNE